jgi:RecA-family ATPase
MAGFDPDVILLETLRRLMVGSELDAEDVGKFWRNVEPIRAEGKTSIVSHHMRKPSGQGINESRHRASRSTDILGGSGTAFAVTRKDQSLASSSASGPEAP